MKPCAAPHVSGGEQAVSSWESMVINPIISAGSNALQTLEQLWSSRQSSAGGAGASVFSTGQTLPAGANATSGGQAPSTPASQFDAAALNFLTSLQDAGSSVAQQVTSSGYLSSLGQGAVQQGLGDLTSIVNQLEQALTGASSGGATTSSATPTSAASVAASDLTHLASTASAAASALTSGTTTATLSALSQLEATLQSLGLGGHHHHHHWNGGPQGGGSASGSGSATSNSGASSGTGTTSVAATTPAAANGAAG
jgi:hypothetical protein